MNFQYLKNWQNDFLFQNLFLHPKSFTEQFSRGAHLFIVTPEAFFGVFSAAGFFRFFFPFRDFVIFSRRRKRRLHGCMARGGHGIPKVLPGPALPYPSTPCGGATPEMALWLFQGFPAHMAGGLRPYFTPLDTPCRTRMEGFT
jgi:hypothetical protein